MFKSLKQVEIFFTERRVLGIKPGLDRMYRLLESQLNPQKKFKTIHIAGTNGKGSTIAFIKAALIANNYKVGVFTSPSLTGFSGHMLINDMPIHEKEFILHFNQLVPVIEELDIDNMHPTEFEIITTIAFMHFAENVDIAIIETGMGGREDTTNCIHPILSIITNIAMDHANFLGDTLEKIAYHKAGIIKRDIPTVVGAVEPICLPVIYKEATDKNSRIYQINKDFFYLENTNTVDRQTFKWNYKELVYPIEIGMKGIHQVGNASVALMALKIINDQDFPLVWETVCKAMSSVQLAGRFEKVHNKPDIILDGAHNPNGMEAFLDTVQNLYKNKKKHLVFAGFRDKELDKMLKMAFPYFNMIYVTSFEHPRAEKAEKLMESFRSEKVILAKWKKLINEMGTQDDIYFFVGSLAFIGLVRAYIKK